MIEQNRLGAKHGSGRFNRLFEEAFAKKLGVAHAICLNSGTAALHAALVGAGVGSGDHVIVDPLLRFGAVAALRVGAVPIFADVDPETFLLSANSLAKSVTAQTKAVVATALFGLPVPVQAYRAALSGRSIAIIEDCAHALFTAAPDGMAGARGDAGVFSFHSSKHLSTGEGGMLVTNNATLAERAIELKEHGWAPGRETWEGPAGWMYRMPEPCAAIGYFGMQGIASAIDRNRAIGRLLNDVVNDVDWLRPQSVPPDTDHSYWTWAARATDASRLARLRERLEPAKTEFEFGYCAHGPIYLRPFLQRYRPVEGPLAERYRPGLCPEAERIIAQLLHLRVDTRAPSRIASSHVSALRNALNTSKV